MSRNRRLVPMPTQTEGPDVRNNSSEANWVVRASKPIADQAAWTPPAPPTFRTAWPHFAWLVGAGIVYYFFGKLILLIAAVVALIRGYLWLCWRFPRTMLFVTAFLKGLLGRGRRRRW